MKKVARLRTSPTMSEDQRQHHHQAITNEAVAVRTTGRIKKPKAVFDPSDNYLPRAQRLPAAYNSIPAGFNTISQESRNTLSRLSVASSESSVLPKEVCVVCGKRESKRTSFAMKNPLISCLDCESKIHRHCLKYDFSDLEQMRQSYRCEYCTPCAICHKNNQSNAAVNNSIQICCKCLNAYHLECLSSSGKQNDGAGADWKCPKCTLNSDLNNDENLPVKKIREIIGDHISPTAASQNSISGAAVLASNVVHKEMESTSPYSDDIKTDNHSAENDSGKDLDTEEKSDVETKRPCINRLQEHSVKDLPNVHKWSVDQVFDYFKQHFPKEAYVFKDQEIDGPSLLLMKRSDVVKKLPLKLGPSLRLYNAILKIQDQNDDPTLGWNCNV